MSRIKGADRVIRLLTNAVGPAITVGLVAVAAELQNELMDAPSPSGNAQPFKSDKQRRFFFAMLRKGKLKVPYRRSGDLGRGWSPRIAGPLRVVLANSQSHSVLVHGLYKQPNKQAKYHRGTWPNVDEAWAKVEPKAVGIMEQAIKAALT